jgi:hypothetical protein
MIAGSHVTRPVDTTWDYPGLAYCGALIGVIVAVVHTIYGIVADQSDAADTFTHIVAEAAIFAAAGAILAMASGAIYRLLQQRL